MEDAIANVTDDQSESVVDLIIASTVQLANGAKGRTDRIDVERAFAIQLAVLRSLPDGGVTYSGELPSDAGSVELFIDDVGSVVTIVPRGRLWETSARNDVRQLDATLKAAGWADAGYFTHPSVQKSYKRGSQSIRFELAGRYLIKLELIASRHEDAATHGREQN